MRWLILWAAALATTFGQSGTFRGTSVDPDSGRTQVISGTISGDVSSSTTSMSQEFEMMRQTSELREQTALLRKISKQASGGPSSYVPAPILVAPSAFVPPASHDPMESKEERAARIQKRIDEHDNSVAVSSAQHARSFNAADKKPRQRQLYVNEIPPEGFLNSPTNEEFIRSLLQSYEGSFTDYKWSMEKLDSQTYLVRCAMSLDGEPHDFKFRVNLSAGICRYEGGTALSKLAAPRKIESVPAEENPSEPLSDATLEKLGLERVSYEELYGPTVKD